MSLPDNYSRTEFIAGLYKFVENIVRYAEEENEVKPEKEQLSGKQKLSRCIYLFQFLYSFADWYFNFPEFIDKVIERLPEIINGIVAELNFFGIFKHKEQVI